MAERFSSPPDPKMFYAQVWEIVCQIPEGRVATYGQVAALIAPPQGMEEKDYRAQAPRWVGGAMAICPPGVPWQRVINAQGRSSLKGVQQEHQCELLRAEGIVFDERERIDLKRFGWSGPGGEPGRPV